MPEEQDLQAPKSGATETLINKRSKGALHALFRLRMFQVLGYREFRYLWFGQAAMAMGTWMDQVARGWLIYELTNSTVQLGLVRGVQALPILFLSPLAGTTADRFNRKTQVLVAQSLDGLMYGSLAILIVTGLIKPWHVYVTAFGMAIVQTFQHPARAAMIGDSVPQNRLTNAIGLNSVVFNVSRSTGPALAGVLIAAFGTASSYFVQAAFFILATVATARLTIGGIASETSPGPKKAKLTLGQSILEGWKFSWKTESVRAGLLIMMAASLFIIPFSTLLPVFARDILGVGATGQGLLLTGMGLGALCSAVLLASLGDQLPRGILMLGGVTLYGLSVIAFSASPSFQLSLILMSLVGLFHVTSHALVQTVVQTYSPSEFRGRTMAIYHQGHFVHTVGSMLIGTLASIWGTQWAVGGMGLMGAVSIIAIFLSMPRIRLIR